MGASLSVKAYSSTESKEFQKHYRAVEFCIENELSFPKETSEFFKGKLDGSDLEEIAPSYIMDYIKNGVEIPIQMNRQNNYITIKVSDIPKDVDIIVAKISY